MKCSEEETESRLPEAAGRGNWGVTANGYRVSTGVLKIPQNWTEMMVA